MKTERRIIKTVKYTLVAFFLLLLGAACAFCAFSPMPTHQAQARSSTPMPAAAVQPGTWSQSRESSSWGGCTAKVEDPLWQPWVEAAVPQAAAVAVNKAGVSSALAVSEVLHSTAIRAQDPELTAAVVVEDLLTITAVDVEGAGIVAAGSLHATTSAATEHAAGTLAVQETAHTTRAAAAVGPLGVIEALAVTVTDSAEDVAFAAESRTAATAVCFAPPAESAVEAVAPRTALDNGTAGVVVPLGPAVVKDSSAMATPVVADNAAGITAAVKDNSPHNTEQALVHIDTSAMMSLTFEPEDQPTAADPILFLTVDADMDAAVHSDGTKHVSADVGPVLLDIATDSVEVNVLAGMGRVVCLLHTCVCCHPGCFILLGLLSHHACQAFLLCFAVTTALRIIFWVLLMRLF